MTSKYKEIAFWWNKNSNRLSEVGYVAEIFTWKITDSYSPDVYSLTFPSPPRNTSVSNSTTTMQDSVVDGDGVWGGQWRQKAWEGMGMICSPFKALKEGQVKNGVFKQSLTRMLRIILERGYNMMKREKILAYKTQRRSRRSSETHRCNVLCARKNTWH